MNMALWIAASVLAGVMLLGSASKLLVPKERLAAVRGGGWTADASFALVKTMGALEFMAAMGLTMPAVVGVAPGMVSVTAACVVLLMVGAMVTHGRRGEAMFVLLNVSYLALAAFVAWGRLSAEPFMG